jgi:phosphohistidine phosphatase SixA
LGKGNEYKIMLKINYSFTLPVCIVFLLVSVATHRVNASEDLWNALKQGGKVVLMRHAPVERGPESGNPLLRDPSCKHERNLSSQGRRNAEIVGGRFRQHEIPVSKVLHSPFCRTTDTANIAFDRTSPAEYLSLLEVLEPAQAAQQTAQLNQVIESYKAKGNLVLVTHEPNISAVSFELMKHLDILVIDPKGDGEYTELGVIRFSASE